MDSRFKRKLRVLIEKCGRVVMFCHIIFGNRFGVRPNVELANQETLRRVREAGQTSQPLLGHGICSENNRFKRSAVVSIALQIFVQTKNKNNY